VKAPTKAQQRAARDLRARVAADLMAGVEGAPLYDAWGGAGWWVPKVKLSERDAGIVAQYVADLVAVTK
jgi:hypothetical protein